MDLTKFIGKNVKVETTAEGYYYKGKVTNADEDSIELIDINGKNVQIMKIAILLIKEDYVK